MITNSSFDETLHNPPKYKLTNFHSKHILKKEDDPINIEKFRKILKLISWDLRHIGCDWYAPYNHKNIWTKLECRNVTNKDGKTDNVRMEMFHDKDLIGIEYGGNIHINLKYCEIIILGGDYLYIDAPNNGNKANSSMALSFSNHDKKYTPHEEYYTLLPRDYQMIMKCSRCKTKINESYKVPGIYFLIELMPGLSAPFNAPRCPKCQYKSYSDINFAITTQIYRVKTNRQISRDSIKKLHKDEYKHFKELQKER